MSVQGVDETPVFEEFLFGNFADIERDTDFVSGESILEEPEVETEVVLIFGVEVEAVKADGSGEVMVDDFAVDNAVTKVLYFHFGAGVGDDLFDPGEDGGLGRHGRRSAGFLDHEEARL